MEKEGLLEADTILPKCSTGSMVLHSGGKIKKSLVLIGSVIFFNYHRIQVVEFFLQCGYNLVDTLWLRW